ncbi:MAG: hypothetical protein K940chlam3_00987 [Chlamydiae bacterium]|nr:hypothetical protein [Chlamydiota bacterium]
MEPVTDQNIFQVLPEDITTKMILPHVEFGDWVNFRNVNRHNHLLSTECPQHFITFIKKVYQVQGQIFPDFTKTSLINSELISKLDPRWMHIRILEINNISLSENHINHLAKFIEKSSFLESLILWNFDEGFALENDGLIRIAQAIAKSRSFRKLDVYDCQFEFSGLEAFTTALHSHPTMEKLSIIRRPRELSLEEMGLYSKFLAHNSVLKSIAICSVDNMTPEHISILAQGLRDNHTLEDLDLGGNNIGPCGVQHIADLMEHSRSLKKIRLSQNNIGNEGMEMVARALEINTSVQELSFSECGIRGGEAIAQVIRVSQTLKYLFFQMDDIGPEGGEVIAEALKDNESLEVLIIPRCDLRTRGVDAIFRALQTNKTLKYLDVSVNAMTGTDEVEAMLTMNTSLETLDLLHCDLGEEGMNAIARGLSANHTLVHLELGGISVPDDWGSRMFEGLKENTTFKYLDLFAIEITEQVASDILVNLLRLSCLEELHMVRSELGPDTREIGRALGENTSIKKLEIAQNNIGSEGVKWIAEALIHNRTLTELSLQSDEIDNNGAQYFTEALESNETIKKIDLRDNDRIDNERIMELLHVNQSE